MKKLAIVLIRNDRRLLDHEGLLRSQEFDQFLILATYPPQWNIQDRISSKRKEFIQASLNAFADSLDQIPLHFHESPEMVIHELQEKFDVSVFCEEQGAEEEERQLQKIRARIIRTKANTIFDEVKLYPTFTPFRSYADKYLRPSFPLGKVNLKPEIALRIEKYLHKKFPVTHDFCGEEKALKRVEFYLTHYLHQYEETRNYLESEEGSSKFSYFLSHGELSVRWLYHEITKRDPKNWLNVELLWREFFWHHKIDFTLPSQGRKINDWPNKIHHPLAKAIYNELITTGYISNRSRQILASYLIYELNLDWKIGALFYEKHLFDYDVFVNWGNWQYIAGVKFDPRGGRKFNLELQAEKYDFDGLYQSKWDSLHKDKT
jgi:deoxyribodipyrimidine photo-lyase